MPTKRFNNLDSERKKTILDAARQEFVSKGFRDASLNGIIKNAGISKGSLYYYFEDKSDLYLTVMDEVFGEIYGLPDEFLNDLSCENFWSAFEAHTVMNMRYAQENPDVVVLSRDLVTLTESPHASEAMADFYAKIQDMYTELFKKGLTLGAVRDDIPLELILSIIIHMGAALDYFVFERWDDYSPEELNSYAIKYSDMVKKIASPESKEGGEV